MKVNEELSLLVMLEKSKITKDGKAPIFIRLTIEGQRREISLGIKTIEKTWNQLAGRVEGNSQEARLTNNIIDTAKIAIRRHYDALKINHVFVSAQMVKDAYKGVAAGREKCKGLVEVLDIAITKIKAKVEKEQRKRPTLVKWNTAREKAASFIQYAYKQGDLALDKLTPAFAEEFVDYLMLEQNIQTNTANKYLKMIRGAVTKAVDNGWVKNNPLNTYTCSYIEPEKDILDDSEILTLYHKKMPVERLEDVKNAYLFMCFTGFAYKDASLLTPDNIITHFDGNRWLVKNREKVTSTVCKENVPLLPLALEIIEKYKDDAYCKAHNRLLPISSNQKYNAYLKEIAAICGINKDLTTHTARHTFATTVTLANGVPLETVSAMLGHKSIKTTQIYAKIVGAKVSADMKQLQERLIVKMPTIMLRKPGNGGE
ncbi:site-specific integrase [Mucilaginibacter sp. RS28]|uniref:Site-specific integrase n=1 Tax=Mucilaginibacter straminoryzae TaxID=2932774 RepID=A0A9X1WZ03_9SPHI|nr:site-specific integrase [Mucilaginibacter straminoryzae]MCJ8208134.1 site-specific integrase [Mucilaginibacter straminoryzae]